VSLTSTNAKKKADLISKEKIYISKKIKLPAPFERSTTGPGSCVLSVVINYDATYVKMQVSRNNNELYSLQQTNGTFNIIKENKAFIENIKIIPNYFHAPKQIFLNLENRCIYNCAFCNKSNQDFLKKYSTDDFVKLIDKAVQISQYSAVSLTSGIYPNNKHIIEKMRSIVSEVKKKYPTMPVGVEPCVFTSAELTILKNAGADEIKINLQIPEKHLFTHICPDFNYDNTIKILEEAVQLFGKGKVTTNLLFGLGESTESVITILDMLSSKGIVPTLRKIRINSENEKQLKNIASCKISEVSAETILYLGNMHKKILEKYNLTTKSFSTMCHACGCCDIVPFWDI
jgi:biotin synthase-related radical SAM superfamily protein